jgi:catechol 2,3-dioxygenase-like lactoylglutathione lyase family enzyme
MLPKLEGFDHIHVYVPNRERAAAWYEEMLDFTINKDLEIWAKNKHGPLTIEAPTGRIHLALFAVDNHIPSTAIAFKSSGQEFLAWKSYLEKQNMLLRCTNHKAAWSLYFNDLDKNMHEITTYQHDYVSEHLIAGLT